MHDDEENTLDAYGEEIIPALARTVAPDRRLSGLADDEPGGQDQRAAGSPSIRLTSILAISEPSCLIGWATVVSGGLV